MSKEKANENNQQFLDKYRSQLEKVLRVLFLLFFLLFILGLPTIVLSVMYR